MPDDIVQELNDWAHIVDESQGRAIITMLSGAIFRDAADEIKQLRAAGDALANWADHNETCLHTSKFAPKCTCGLREVVKNWEARRV